jgi:hypothetical protein
VVTAAPGANGPDFEIAQPILIVSCARAGDANAIVASSAAHAVAAIILMGDFMCASRARTVIAR